MSTEERIRIATDLDIVYASAVERIGDEIRLTAPDGSVSVIPASNVKEMEVQQV